MARRGKRRGAYLGVFGVVEGEAEHAEGSAQRAGRARGAGRVPGSRHLVRTLRRGPSQSPAVTLACRERGKKGGRERGREGEAADIRIAEHLAWHARCSIASDSAGHRSARGWRVYQDGSGFLVEGEAGQGGREGVGHVCLAQRRQRRPRPLEPADRDHSGHAGRRLDDHVRSEGDRDHILVPDSARYRLSVPARYRRSIAD
eukprot:771330-Rhodomonas_salina.1